MPQPPSTRWCPTPEQLMILEEMYRSGIRTPNASLIQQITAHLSYYGKIEGKNVFYWFQNHKARDRQKLRRRLNRHQQMLLQQHQIMEPSNPPLQHHQLPNQEVYQEANQVMNLVGNLETCEVMENSTAAAAMTISPASYEHEWMTTMGAVPPSCRPMTTSPASYEHEWMTTMGAVPPSCRPLKTLELFPTTSTGLKEECSTSKSSSCSTSTN